MRRLRVWPALLGLTAALTVLGAGSAGLSGAKLPIPAWALASIVAGIGILVSAVISPLVATHLKVLGDRLARWEERQAHQVAAVERSTAGTGLPLVRDLTSRRVLGIHAAIPLAASHDPTLSAELPVYVPRDRDADVHAALTRMSTTGGFLLLVGAPASGKTRCAATAAHRLLGDWRMLIPDGAAGLAMLVDSGADLRRTVVWLDDIHELSPRWPTPRAAWTWPVSPPNAVPASTTSSRCSPGPTCPPNAATPTRPNACTAGRSPRATPAPPTTSGY
jgi:hypothetical protein